MPAQIANENYDVGTPLGTSRSVFNINTLEGATSTYTVTFQTLAGGPIANTELTSIELTLFTLPPDVPPFGGIIINDRQDQDVLGVLKTGANNVTVSATSEVVWTLQPADNVIVDTTNLVTVEPHLARFKVVYDVGAGAETLIHEVVFNVRRLVTPI